MNYIDFAIAVSIFLFFFTMVLILSTNYFSNISGLTKISEFQSVAEGVFKLLFGGKGVPEDWEDTSGLNPVQLGLIEDLYRIPVLVKETSGYNRTNELINVNLIFDQNCENKSWNNTVRVFDENGDEIYSKMYNQTFCSSQFLKQARVVWETNLSANQNKKFYVYYSSDDGIHASNYTDTFSTVAYWHFDEGSGSTAYDETRNDNDGTLYNGTEVSSQEPTWKSGSDCKSGSCLEFDGSNDFVEISNNPSLNPQNEITIEAWIKIRELKFSGIVGMWEWYLTDPSWLLVVYSNDLTMFINGTGGTDNLGEGVALPLNSWQHVVGIYNGTYMILYRNGIQVAIKSTSIGNLASSTQNVEIGRYNQGSPFNGTIDEIRIWNRALSPEEINASYISGPIPIKSFPEENLDVLSSSKINALKNLSYEETLKILGDYKFRIEISEIE